MVYITISYIIFFRELNVELIKSQWHKFSSLWCPNLAPDRHRLVYVATKGCWQKLYHQTSNISCTKFENLNVFLYGLAVVFANPLKPGLSQEWRSRWSSADTCSNYIWVINNFIAYWGATYIRGLTVRLNHWSQMSSNFSKPLKNQKTLGSMIGFWSLLWFIEWNAVYHWSKISDIRQKYKLDS